MKKVINKICFLFCFFFRMGPYRIPEKSEIAALIDRHLGDDNGRDDGRIIRIEYNNYQY